MSAARVLVVDHRDSFVHLLVDELARLGAEVQTLRSGVSLRDLQGALARFDPDLLLLSPGPGHPREAGVMLPFLETEPRLPILGVCLGHQALALADGGSVERAAEPVHGRGDRIEHTGDPLFEGLPPLFRAARYHSLLVTRVPSAYRVIARLAERPGSVMAIRHRELPRTGLQFHPESILTPYGGRLIRNLLDDALRHRR